MKTLVAPVVIAISFAFSVPVMAQMNHGGMQGGGMSGGMSGGMGSGSMQGGKMQSGTAPMAMQHGADAAMGEGLVKKVDKTKGTVTLAHGAMNGMPAMTMAYRVKDASLLDKLAVGQTIRFATDPADGGMTVSRFELVK